MLSMHIEGTESLKTQFNKAPEIFKTIMKSKMDMIEKVVLRGAKYYAPVDTGRLRADIRGYSNEKEAILESKVHYAIYVHEGTKYQQAQPYMDYAIRDSKSDIETILQTGLDAIIRELKK